jgi:hypothetical protein
LSGDALVIAEARAMGLLVEELAHRAFAALLGIVETDLVDLAPAWTSRSSSVRPTR